MRKKSQKGGNNHPSYIIPDYTFNSASAGRNILVASNQIVRPSIGGGKRRTKKLSGGALPFPIASRNISRNEPLYPAIHA
jgi:hypothetical protein